MSSTNPRYPRRTFSADVGQYSIGTAGPDQIEYDLDNLFAMLDPSRTLKDGSPGGIGAENMQDMTIDHSQSPTSNTANPEILLSRLANRIRAIMGESDWKNDPDTTLAAVKTALDGLVSVVKKVNNVSPDANGNFTVEAGTGIAVTQGTNKITVTATGGVTPGSHADSHATTGPDPISPASIGAATPADITAHANNPSAHHTRYTNAEAVAAVKAADGAGSEFDADLLDGYHASAFAAASHSHATATPTTDGFMSASDKAKLDSIEVEEGGLTPNTFTNILVGTTTITADSSSDILELVAGANIALTPDATNDKITIAVTGPVPQAADADKVDGKHASEFAPSSHVGAVGGAHGTATNAVAGFMSPTDKAKLDGIQTGAEVNQNAFSYVKVGASTIAADSKTDTLELVAGTNISLTPDTTNDKVTIAVTGTVANATNADTVDGYHASAFAAASHTHLGSDITSAVASASNADTVDGVHATAFAENVATVNSKRAGYAVYAP